MSVSDIDNQSGVACLMTPRGRGAVATIALRAPLEQLAAKTRSLPSFFLPRNRKPLHQQSTGKILFGKWGEEELVVCRTGDDEIEIHCHGGEAAVSRILSDLEKLGISIVDASDYLKMVTDVWEADYVQAISRARTFRTASLLLQQREIGLEIWRELEKSLETNYWRTLDEQARSSHRKMIQQMRQWAEFGRHLGTPWHVVIGGPANVGKSSLINILLGYERAIVVDQPGTTRDVVSAETALQGWPVLLSDTAGLRETGDHLESIGIELASRTMQKADLQILLLDRSISPDRESRKLLASFPDALFVFNKTELDAVADWEDVEFPRPPLEVSCRTGAGIEHLVEKITQRLIPRTPPVSLVYPVTDRQLSLLNQLEQQVN